MLSFESNCLFVCLFEWDAQAFARYKKKIHKKRHSSPLTKCQMRRMPEIRGNMCKAKPQPVRHIDEITAS